MVQSTQDLARWRLSTSDLMPPAHLTGRPERTAAAREVRLVYTQSGHCAGAVVGDPERVGDRLAGGGVRCRAGPPVDHDNTKAGINSCSPQHKHRLPTGRIS